MTVQSESDYIPEVDGIVYIPRHSQIGRPTGWYWRGPLFLYGPFRTKEQAKEAYNQYHNPSDLEE